MLSRWRIVAILLVLAGISAWLLNKIVSGVSTDKRPEVHIPDYTMENFTTWSMKKNGSPKSILQADYMAHYPDNDATEFHRPYLQLFRQDRLPVHVVAEKGWATNNNEVLLLEGKVRLWEQDEAGVTTLEIITREVRVLVDQEYAETEQPATIIRDRTTVKATGVRAWLKENRMELLNNVHTTIAPEKAD